MNLAEVLAEQTRLRGAIPALIARRRGKDVVMTFRELTEAVENAAGLLAGAGLQAGDRVLVFQAMSVELYVALLAMFRLGLTAMFLDPSAGRKHIERCCQMGQPKGLVAATKAHWLRLVSGPLRRIPIQFAIGWPMPGTRRFDFSRETRPTAVFPVAEETEALLTFTSGSTGLPKAAVRTHGFLLAQHRVLENSIHLQAGEIDLATLPVFVLANLASGVTSLLPDADLRRPGLIDPAPVARQMAKFRPTRTAASPAFFERLLDYYERCPEEARKCSLRQIYTGGAAVFPSLLQRLQRTFPQALPVAVYGSTEAEPIAHISVAEMSANDLRAMHSGRGILAGRPVPEIAVRIGKDQEIQVSGDHVLTGYLNGEGDGETKIHEAGTIWHRTGDAGRFDPEGRLWLLGRCSARLGNGLHPFAIEGAAMFFDWVRRCGCVEVKGRRMLALETRAHSATDLAQLQTALAWAALDQVVVVRKIPVDRRHNAKIDYGALRQLLRPS